MSQIGQITAAVLIAALAFLAGRFTSPARALLDAPEGAAFVTAFNAIREHHLKPASAATLAQAGTQGLLNGQNDPFLLYTPADQAQVLEDLTRDGFVSGIGVEHRPWRADGTGDQITVVPEDSPAARAGIKAGDVILAIDGQDVSNLKLREVARKRIGAAGTPMRLRIQRDQKTLEITVMRERIKLVTVRYRVLEPGVGLIHIDDFFDADIPAEFRNATQALRRQGANKLVIDLRDNGGGLIGAATQIADQLLQSGAILTTRDRDGQTKITHRASASPDDLNWPLVILTNHGTASASEILVSALHDAKRASIVGTPTRGKGVADAQVKLPDGSLLFLPVVEWLNANGTSLNGQGIQPDVSITDTRYVRPLEVRVNGATANAPVKLQIGTFVWQGQTDATGKLERELSLQTSPNTQDRQLERAVQVLRERPN
jgi:carboxyl-terminal processing protease